MQGKSSQEAKRGKSQKLQVTIAKATGLKHLNWAGDAPWCKCVVNGVNHGESCSTKALTGTLDPEWNETHEVSWQKGDFLIFTLYDKGMVGSKIEGEVTVRSEDFQDHGFQGDLPISGLDHATLTLCIVPPACEELGTAVQDIEAFRLRMKEDLASMHRNGSLLATMDQPRSEEDQTQRELVGVDSKTAEIQDFTAELAKQMALDEYPGVLPPAVACKEISSLTAQRDELSKLLDESQNQIYDLDSKCAQLAQAVAERDDLIAQLTGRIRCLKGAQDVTPIKTRQLGQDSPGLDSPLSKVEALTQQLVEAEGPGRQSQGKSIREAQGGKNSQLQVTIVKATGLKHLNLTGDAPWCKCMVQRADAGHHGESFSTKALTRTLDPVWNETHELSWQRGDSLLFTIYDKGLIGSKTEGQVTVRSEDFQDYGFTGDVPISGLDHATLSLRIVPAACEKLVAAVQDHLEERMINDWVKKSPRMIQAAQERERQFQAMQGAHNFALAEAQAENVELKRQLVEALRISSSTEVARVNGSNGLFLATAGQHSGADDSVLRQRLEVSNKLSTMRGTTHPQSAAASSSGACTPVFLGAATVLPYYTSSPAPMVPMSVSSATPAAVRAPSAYGGSYVAIQPPVCVMPPTASTAQPCSYVMAPGQRPVSPAALRRYDAGRKSHSPASLVRGSPVGWPVQSPAQSRPASQSRATSPAGLVRSNSRGTLTPTAPWAPLQRGAPVRQPAQMSTSMMASQQATMMVNVPFQPGRLDFVTRDAEIVLVSEGQAKRLGVQVGWRVCAVDGERYDEQMLQIKQAGSKPYDITFQTTSPSFGLGNSSPRAFGLEQSLLRSPLTTRPTLGMNPAQPVFTFPVAPSATF